MRPFCTRVPEEGAFGDTRLRGGSWAGEEPSDALHRRPSKAATGTALAFAFPRAGVRLCFLTFSYWFMFLKAHASTAYKTWYQRQDWKTQTFWKWPQTPSPCPSRRVIPPASGIRAPRTISHCDVRALFFKKDANPAPGPHAGPARPTARPQARFPTRRSPLLDRHLRRALYLFLVQRHHFFFFIITYLF